MRTRIFPHVACALLAVAISPTALADNANCDVYKKGKHQKAMSGKCNVTEAHNIVKVRLHNGEEHTLTPGKKDKKFRDQNNKKVSLSFKKGKNVYQWEHKRIEITFAD
jgi:hypothetical protein